MPGAKVHSQLCRGIGMAVALFCAVLVMTSHSAAQSGQRPLPLVAVCCGNDLKLCRALVGALAEVAPGAHYHINPKSKLHGVMEVRMEQRPDGTARLHWPGGTGEIARRDGRDDAAFARRIVTRASPALILALQGA